MRRGCQEVGESCGEGVRRWVSHVERVSGGG